MTVDSLSAWAKTLKSSVTNGEELAHAITALVKAAVTSMTKDLNTSEDFNHVMATMVYSALSGNEGGYLNISNYLDMLDYNNKSRFEKYIPLEVFELLQEKATEKIAAGTVTHPAELNHLKNIVKGRVPFGYTIIEEEMMSDKNNYEARSEATDEELIDKIGEDNDEYIEFMKQMEQELADEAAVEDAVVGEGGDLPDEYEPYLGVYRSEAVLGEDNTDEYEDIYEIEDEQDDLPILHETNALPELETYDEEEYYTEEELYDDIDGHRVRTRDLDQASAFSTLDAIRRGLL